MKNIQESHEVNIAKGIFFLYFCANLQHFFRIYCESTERKPTYIYRKFRLSVT